MEVRDFLYHFTDILFSEIVKETILIENWEESDFDYRYAEYIIIFQNMLEACQTGGSTDEVLMNRLVSSRKTIIDLFNKEMKDNFTAQFVRYGISDPARVASLMPADLFKDNTIRVDMFSIFRTLEEKILRGSRKGDSLI
ncbi:MAG: hypothetical protein LBP42_01510 [Treponema sp.]|jgi:hypothetical protein|nr:hypothetical protein [Treponema sp.]